MDSAQTPLEELRAAARLGQISDRTLIAVETLSSMARAAADQIEGGYAKADYDVTANLRLAADAVAGFIESRAGQNEETRAGVHPDPESESASTSASERFREFQDEERGTNEGLSHGTS